VEMLLMFTLGRQDVLPVDDYGVRDGYRAAYGLRALPTPKALLEYGERWRPHRTTASWYLWRAAEHAKATKKKRVPPAAQKGPDARRRAKAAREA